MFEETSIGQSVIDSSGNGNNGAQVNITSPNGPSTNAIVGARSLSTDGSDDFVNVPADSSLDLSGGQFSQSVWIYPEHTDSGFHGIIGYHDNGYLQRYPGIWIKDSNKIHAGFGDGSGVYSFSTTDPVVTPFAWNHVVTTFDGNEYKLYVDGAQVFSSFNASGQTPFPTQQMTIGRVDNQYDGLIDDVRIYNNVLSATEVSNLFNQSGSSPGTLALQSSSFSIDEDGGTLSVPVVRTGGSDGTVTINYATSNGSAAAGSDYTASSGTLTFADGITSQTINVPILNDTADEGDETFNITLSAPGGGASLGSPSAGVATIIDDDSPSNLTVTIAAASISEGAGAAATTGTVTRTGDLSGSLSVTLASNDTSEATVGSPVTIPSGQASATFNVNAVDDSIVDGTQTVTITASASGFSSGSDTVNVTDDDSPGAAAAWSLIGCSRRRRSAKRSSIHRATATTARTSTSPLPTAPVPTRSSGRAR